MKHSSRAVVLGTIGINIVIHLILSRSHLSYSLRQPQNKTAATATATATRNKTAATTPQRSVFGFFLQCHRQPRATFQVIKDIRENMGNSTPIHLVSSAGYNYTPLAERYDVDYRHENNNVDMRFGRIPTNVLVDWVHRIYRAAKECNCDYLVVMEDDVRLVKPLDEAKPPPHDAGGVKAHLWTSHWSKRTFERFPHWSYISHGMCGGSYLRVEAFVDAVERLNETIPLLRSVEPRSLARSDIFLAGLMMAANYTLKPWDQLVDNLQFNNKRYLSSHNLTDAERNAPLIHGKKELYGVGLKESDGPVLAEPLGTVFVNGRYVW